MSNSERETIRKLRKIIDEQQDEIWHLKRALGFDLGFKLGLGLSRTELRLFVVMIKDGSLTHERGKAILLSNNPELKDPYVLLNQHIHNMRIKLAKIGVTIRNQKGMCHYLDSETLARVRPMIIEDEDGLDKITKRSRTNDRPVFATYTAGGRANGTAAN